MRLIYNQGGIGHAREAQRVQDRAFKKQGYSSGEKMKLVRAVDKLGYSLDGASTPAHTSPRTIGNPHIVETVFSTGKRIWHLNHLLA